GQVLANLLSNALRHTPEGGTVTISVRPDGADTAIDVTDTGDGIDPAHLPHLFERFYRSDSARDRDHGGTGVGLTISQGIARAHGGNLTATSAGPGRGATFTLTLPAAGSVTLGPAPSST
ncbi:MAG TPA: sensor histidine kinase, partial [Propionibacteriaceae bacterium]|nr:sensor histidine kinase [Propionibacteriaceae bacterium]